MSRRYADTNALRQVWEPERQQLLRDLDVANRITSKLKQELESLRQKLLQAQDVIRAKEAIINSHFNAGSAYEGAHNRHLPSATSVLDNSSRATSVRALSPSGVDHTAIQLLAALVDHVRSASPSASSAALSAAEAFLRSYPRNTRARSAPSAGDRTPPPAERRRGQGARAALGTPSTPGHASVQENLAWLRSRHPVWRDTSIAPASCPAFVAGSVSRPSSSERAAGGAPHTPVAGSRRKTPSRGRVRTPGHSGEGCTSQSVGGSDVEPLPASDSYSSGHGHLDTLSSTARAEQSASTQAMRALAANLLAVTSPDKSKPVDSSQVTALADRLAAVAGIVPSSHSQPQGVNRAVGGARGGPKSSLRVPPPYVPAARKYAQPSRTTVHPLPARPSASTVVSSPSGKPLHEAQRVHLAQQQHKERTQEEEHEVPPFVVEVGGGPAGPKHAPAPEDAPHAVSWQQQLQGTADAGTPPVPPWMAHLGMTLEEARARGGVYGPGAPPSTATASAAGGPAYMSVPLPAAFAGGARGVQDDVQAVRSYGS